MWLKWINITYVEMYKANNIVYMWFVWQSTIEDDTQTFFGHTV